MNLNVIIVEDQFLESDNLSIILKNAGHSVLGIAKSVDQAVALLKKNNPDIVLVDIVLKGDLNGIDLARILDKKNLPFIFLSANSNATTLRQAVATKPYGFLVKPFREKELLMALNIAVYRYQKNIELSNRQRNWLSGLLTAVIEMPGNKNEKILSLIRALTSFLPFDFIIIDTKLTDKNDSVVYRYHRTGFDAYEKLCDKEIKSDCGLSAAEMNAARKKDKGNSNAYFQNGQDFIESSALSPLLDKMRQAKNFTAVLWLPLPHRWELDMAISFYRCGGESYTNEHLDLMVSMQELLAEVVDSIRQPSVDRGASAKGRGQAEEFKPSKAPTQLLSPGIEGIIGNSPKLIEALDKVLQVAPFDNTVLILGETGVGKEGIVKAIHQLSPRKSRPLVKVNCAAIPITLVESELFGHERGAFTGATERRIGKFEQANGGTLFLDEIGELPVEVQSKLLRALQEKEIERVGGRTTIKTDVRIITATNRNLLKEIAAGRFRMDLYYRVNVFPIYLPPLRERRGDIPALTNHFLTYYGSNIRSERMSFSAAALRQLEDYSWPGNIRELQHLIERHVLQSKSSRIELFEMPDQMPGNEILSTSETEIKSYVEMDREHIVSALKKSNGKISGRGGAAELLKLRPTTLASKMKRLGITWPILLCIPIWLMSCYAGYCQNTHNGLGVPRVDSNMLSATLTDLNSTTDDTTEARLLLRLSYIYYWQDKIRYQYYGVDSAIFFARQAMSLSSQINFTEGLTESEFLLCRIPIDKSDLAGAKRIAEMATGEQRIRLLIVIGEHYFLQPPPVDKDNLQIALSFLMEALSLAEREQSNYWLIQCLADLGKYYYADGQISRGQEFFFRIIKIFEQTHDIANQAYWWVQMDNYMPYAPEIYSQQLSYYQKAIDLYLSIHQKADAGETYGAMAFLVKSMKDLEYAKKLYLKKVALLKEAGKNKFYEAFLYLAQIYYEEGNLDNALNYALQAMRNIELLHADGDLPLAYRLLGDIYLGLNEVARGSYYYRLSLDYGAYSTFITNWGYAVLRNYTTALISQGKGAEALEFANKFISINRRRSIFDEEISQNVLGACYDAVGDINMAEKKYLQMINCDDFCQANKGKAMFLSANIVGTEAYYDIGKFYVSHNRYQAAQPYLGKALTFENVPAPLEKNLNYLQFKTDSASGDFISAIRHYQRSVFLKDSLFAGERLKELNFLKVQFETAEQEKNIKLLEKEAQLQKRKLQQSAQLRMWSGAVMLLLVAFLAILYNRNRLKNKKNIQLERQKEVINDANLSLSQLVREKEWLLKEVHHRVKNNLQIVTSLLNSQSDIIGEGPVLDALVEGKHRIQAMAMIHQRLYNTDDYNLVLMPSYISELVDYLKESFNPGTRIIFKLFIDPVALNLSIAVPLALILNEAITNSLKHGFPDGREGTVTVELQCLGGQTKLLRVADDGVGIPPSVDESNPNSFGLRLIRGFTSDISGTLTIEKTRGTLMAIVFDGNDEAICDVGHTDI